MGFKKIQFGRKKNFRLSKVKYLQLKLICDFLQFFYFVFCHEETLMLYNWSIDAICLIYIPKKYCITHKHQRVA